MIYHLVGFETYHTLEMLKHRVSSHAFWNVDFYITNKVDIGILYILYTVVYSVHCTYMNLIHYQYLGHGF